MHSSQVDRLDSLVRKEPVSFSAFKWTVGIIMMLMLGMFAIPLYSMSDTKDMLHSIHLEQVKTSGALQSTNEKLETWIAIQGTRIGNIEDELKLRHGTMERLEQRSHTHTYSPPQ